MRRRMVMVTTVGLAASLAGCSIGGEEDEGPTVDDEPIEAGPEDVIVTIEDLEAGWREVDNRTGEATFVNSGKNLTVSVTVEQFDGTDTASQEYQTLRQEKLNEGIALDDVDFGNEGFLLMLDKVISQVVFRGGDMVVEVQATLVGESDASVKEQANKFAEIVHKKISEQQG